MIRNAADDDPIRSGRPEYSVGGGMRKVLAEWLRNNHSCLNTISHHSASPILTRDQLQIPRGAGHHTTFPQHGKGWQHTSRGHRRRAADGGSRVGELGQRLGKRIPVLRLGRS
jgi:hypothetical protein